MEEYKLTYWDVRGRAEPIRLILAAANVTFEDNRISKESWPALKKLMPWGQVPILEFDGKVLAQSMTIARYLAQKYNLSGSNEFECAKCSEYVDVLGDLLGEMKKIIHAPSESEKIHTKQAFLKQTLPNCLQKFEDLLIAQDSSFLVAGKLTWADIVFVTMLERLETNNYAGASLLNKYPNIKMLKIAVYNYPGIKEWMETRPKE